MRTARQEPVKIGKPTVKQSIKKGMTARYDTKGLVKSRNPVVLGELITSIPKKRTRV